MIGNKKRKPYLDNYIDVSGLTNLFKKSSKHNQLILKYKYSE